MEMWKIGNLIKNQYEVYQVILSKRGLVYICYDHIFNNPYVLKTYHDRYLENQKISSIFVREATNWINLEMHQNIVRATWVEIIAGKPYIAFEYVGNPDMDSPDLRSWLKRGLLISEVINFSIQFCNGMEYAYNKFGIVHGNIKPGNIFVTKDRTLKISDFGSYVILEEAIGVDSWWSPDNMESLGGGIPSTDNFLETLPYFSPEHCKKERKITIRSDIYAFGTILYEMLTGRLLFKATTLNEFMHCHLFEKPIPPSALVPDLPPDLEVIVYRTLAKNPEERYSDFSELKCEFTKILNTLTGDKTIFSKPKTNDAKDLYNRGSVLTNLNRHEEALEYYKRALTIDPNLSQAWCNKGIALSKMGWEMEALDCYANAINLNPHLIQAWVNKGISLTNLDRINESLACYEHALIVDPRLAQAWSNKGVSLSKLGRHKEAIQCYERSLELNPINSSAWNNKGNSLSALGEENEALNCYERALILDPEYVTALANKGDSLFALKRYQEAVACFDRLIELNSQDAHIWVKKGNSLVHLRRPNEALDCYENAIAIDSSDYMTWVNKGVTLMLLGEYKKALPCLGKALEINPQDEKAIRGHFICKIKALGL